MDDNESDIGNENIDLREGIKPIHDQRRFPLQIRSPKRDEKTRRPGGKLAKNDRYQQPLDTDTDG